MNPTEIEFAVRDLVAKPYDPATFPFDLIAIYNASAMTVSRLKSGTTNKATEPADVLWQKHLFFRPAAPGEDVGAVGNALAENPLTARQKPRFIVVTDGRQVHVRDLKLDESVNIEFERLDEQAYFLLPLAGYERRAVVEEHPADVKAAKKLKKLYDALLAANPTWNAGHHAHELNLLMTRLLFCFYAEDTGIFAVPKSFTNTLTQYTYQDPTAVAPLLDRLFRIMNVEEAKRPKSTPPVEAQFPYVNGSLFENTVEIPQFSLTARRQLLECGDLDWTTINPDIFGSMIQTIAQDGTRSDLGMHYTSVPNIIKVLQPLFLDDLNEAYEKAKDSVPKLETLLGRISTIRVFDPACGSGNFLIIAYRKLRGLEIDILRRIGEITPMSPLRLSGIPISNFYGIDLVDFSCETAKLSLWISEHQMNQAFKDVFGAARPVLPLAKINTIYNGNALTIAWDALCPPSETCETYICGNPPYNGPRTQSADQKRDVAALFAPFTRKHFDLDYVTCFFLKASIFITRQRAKAALVATNSICQGEQVAILWPILYGEGTDIAFAHPSFKWQNNASNNAGVTCVIVGLTRSSDTSDRVLIEDQHARRVKVIGPYLVPNVKAVVESTDTSISSLPPVIFGTMPLDNGNFILSTHERDVIIHADPRAAQFLRPYMGSDDFINNVERYCIWIKESQIESADHISVIKERVDRVRDFRLQSVSKRTRDYGQYPYQFRPNRYNALQDAGEAALLIPSVASERRQYLTIGLTPPGVIVNNLAFACYKPPAYLFALLSSRLHRIWAGAVGGSLETRIRYSNTLVYNTFAVPTLSDEQKRILTDHSRQILRARAKYPGKTIAWLYNPETMPPELQEAHHDNDSFIEGYIYGRRYRDDAHRLESLFDMYAAICERAGMPLLAVSK